MAERDGEGEVREAPAPGRPALKVALAFVFVAVVVTFFAADGTTYLDLGTIKAHRDGLLRFTQAHYAEAIAVAFAIFVAATAFSLPGGLILSLTFGFVFGRWVGTALVVVAGTLGATLLFLAARYVVQDAVRKHLGAIGDRINQGFTQNALSYMLFLRLVPVFPFFLVNLAPALTTIRLRTYVLATFIGLIPGTFVFVSLGEALAGIDSLAGLVSWRTLVAFAMLGALALVPILVQRRRRRTRR